MTKPIRYTDTARYPHGYRHSTKTNIKLSFARKRAAEEAKRKAADAVAAKAQAEDAAIEAETKAKVRTIKARP